MEIKTYKKLIETVQAYEAKCKENNLRRSEAVLEVTLAQKIVNELIDKSINNQKDLSGEIAQAQAKVTIAQEKQRRLLAQIGEANAPLDLTGMTFDHVHREVRQKINWDTLAEEIPELEELKAIGQQYLGKLKEVFIKVERLNKQLGEAQTDALQLTEKYTGKPPYVGSTGFSYISPSELRPWAWVHNDYRNAAAPVMEAARREVQGIPAELKGIRNDRVVVPDKPFESIDLTPKRIQV